MPDLLEQAIEYFPHILGGVMSVSAVVYLAVDAFKKEPEKRIDAEFVPSWIIQSTMPVKAIPAVITNSTHPHPKFMEGERLDYSFLGIALEDEGYTASLRNQESVGDIVVEIQIGDYDYDRGRQKKIPVVVEPGHPKLTKGKRFDYAFLQEALKDGYSVLFKQSPHKTISRK
jgi:hypothetical protein